MPASDMPQDIRCALRTLAGNLGFTAVAVLSLAIGIGANTAIFSVTDALLLRPLPYKDADRLTILWNRSPGLNITEDWFSTAQYFDIKNGHRGFERLAIAIGGNSNLTGDGDPERVGTIRPHRSDGLAALRVIIPTRAAPCPAALRIDRRGRSPRLHLTYAQGTG
jgi:hypothetical protein